MLALLLWLCAMAGVFAQEAQPSLHPPHGELPPTFWEQHGLTVILIGLVLILLAGVTVWWWRRPKPAVVLPPEVRARTALEELAGRPEDGTVLSQASQILRRYVVEAFELSPGEFTTAEFCRVTNDSDKIGDQLAGQLAGFLRECDERKFSRSDAAAPTNAVTRALELITLGEARLARLRQTVESQAPQLAFTAR
jgi:hypothetical protein